MLVYEQRIIFTTIMGEQEQDLLCFKAEAFDRIISHYRNLQNEAGFYSKNWVELADAIETELKKLSGKRQRPL